MKAFLSALAFVAVSLTIGLYLFGCAPSPEPQIITKTVNVEVPVPCKVTLPPRPALMDKDQLRTALAAAPSFDDEIKIATEQLALYLGWTPQVEAALKGCQG